MSDNNKDKVGYKRPPLKNQFKKGQSGNPKGRKKGSQNLTRLIDTGLRKPYSIQENGVTRKMTALEIIALKLIHKAMKADHRALEQILFLNPRLKGPDLETIANKAMGSWVDSLSDEELEKFIVQFEKDAERNNKRNKKTKEDERNKKREVQMIKQASKYPIN